MAYKQPVDIRTAMAGEAGAERVKKYQAPMGAGMVYSYAAKQIDDELVDILQELADEAGLIEKYAALYSGEVDADGKITFIAPKGEGYSIRLSGLFPALDVH
jgi:glucose-6-phosphate isomerase